MRLKEILEPVLFESGHIFAPSFEELLISDKDLAGIARLACREMNKWGNRRIITPITFSQGQAVIPPEYGRVYSVEPVYASGQTYEWNHQTKVLCGPEDVVSQTFALTTDWTVTTVKDPITGVEITADDPTSHSYLDQNDDLPTPQGPVYEIVGYEDSLHREDFDKIMAAYFMIVVGRSRSNFAMNDSIADNNGSALEQEGSRLLEETREILIEGSDQFMGILDAPAMR